MDSRTCFIQHFHRQDFHLADQFSFHPSTFQYDPPSMVSGSDKVSHSECETINTAPTHKAIWQAPFPTIKIPSISHTIGLGKKSRICSIKRNANSITTNIKEVGLSCPKLQSHARCCEVLAMDIGR